MENRISVLDHGFISLVDTMPNRVPPAADMAVVQAARVSYGSGSKGEEKDKKLIKYLLDNGHTSPFEMVEFKFHVKMPIFVARQWVRYRTANINEYSGRYSTMSRDYYIPFNWRMQDKNNKQGSDGIFQYPKLLNDGTEDICQRALLFYDTLITKGIAREQARMVLPVNFYTEWYWKNDLHNVMNFLRQRLDFHAQMEIRVYAGAMLKLVKKVCPWTMEYFEESSTRTSS